ncbi:MAG: FixH family protein [Chloroflexaceae bacterium]|nr:FixH family protein [Chloroflexaceae bacterium]
MKYLLQCILVGALALLIGCGTQATTEPAAAPPERSSAEETVDDITIRLTRNDAPAMNEPQVFLITLLNAQGQPVEQAAEVYLDLTMPAMPMATNQPLAEQLGNGMYQAQSTYTMGGEWEITVVATIDGKEYRAVFDSTVQGDESSNEGNEQAPESAPDDHDGHDGGHQ